MTEPTAPRSAIDIADALGRPHPTPQQQAVIEAPLEPALVVAGAGSGKTETMASRVLWLLANGHVRPDEVLGLTFTRKAAGELSVRVRERIVQLVKAGLAPADLDVFETPTVATYNAFANTIFRDNALVLGRESDGAVLGEAAAWQLARETVVRSRAAGLGELGKSLDQVTEAVLAVSRGLAENVADPDELRVFAREFASLSELPYGDRHERAAAVAFVDSVAALDVLVPVALEYEAAKLRRGVVEYSDQVALALRAAETQPRVAEELRERFRVVILDEYQDTSVVQTRLLARLFAGHPVMAVGDPNQSIYGWRGASADNLDQFARLFGATGRRFSLSTSWRNGRRILDAANLVAEPLSATTRVAVDRLHPSPVATDLPIDVVVGESVLEEAAAVADWLAAQLAPRPDGSVPSAAMLMRARKLQPWFLRALRDRDIPYHVLGLGGLLAEPEVADLVSALAVIHDPAAGLELVRLLAGSRWRIGVQDLYALRGLAGWLRDRDLAQRRLDDEVRERFRSSVAASEGGSIVDALDFLGTVSAEHTALAAFSPLGLERLRDAATTLAALRERSALDLHDLVALVTQELQLDIEVTANPTRDLGSANLEAFGAALDGYLALDAGAGLGGFLRWLREAEQREDLSPRPEDPEPGTVQVLTIHGAKGLEWDAVAVPRLVEEELPARPLEGFTGWLAFGRFPWPFRGDAADLPVLPWREATSRKELAAKVEEFKSAVRERSVAEERRLAYVALTRARHALLLTASHWATTAKPRTPSRFLAELAAAGLTPPLPDGPSTEENPLGDDVETFSWPRDPLGSRREAVERAARAVHDATPALVGPWTEELRLLLAERDARRAADARSVVPPRVPASRFKDYVTDPAAVTAALRRPMPERPYRATRLGTLFHTWVEERHAVGGGADELDAVVEELDLGDGDETAVDPERFAALRANFETSEWAGLRPVEVEREIHLPFAGHTVICKLDAVYRHGEGDDARYEVVDWKTGRAPRDAADLEAKQLQLALYRLAYARWAGIDADRIDAAFYFVADDEVVRPERIDDEAQLLARWRAAGLS